MNTITVEIKNQYCILEKGEKWKELHFLSLFIQEAFTKYL